MFLIGVCSASVYEPVVLYSLVHFCVCCFFTEPCENPEQYVDWDVCADVTPADCRDPDEDIRKLYAEFCPAKCTCSKSNTVVFLVLFNKLLKMR